ncbi:hypothetical protein LTR86_003199 [Recurvomyces mirabilis]|nr:hypothetical protein LTR86_003199 [Recurvomyces mirabilis]
MTGASVVVHQDEGPIEVKEVDVLVSYLNKISHKLRAFSHAESDSDEVKQTKTNETAANLLTAQALAMHAATHSPAP